MAAWKLSLLLMVSVPVLLKLAAVVETLLAVPAMVSFPVLVANPARASVPPELLWMVPPARVRFAALVVMVAGVPTSSAAKAGESDAKADPVKVDSPMISGKAWVGVAKEIQEKLTARM